MKKETKILWGVYLVYTLVHFLLFSISLFTSLEIFDSSSFGVKPYVADYLDRISFFTVLLLVFLVLFVVKKYYKSFNKVLVLFLLASPILLDSLGNFLAWYNELQILGLFQFDEIVHFVAPAFIVSAIAWYLYVEIGLEKGIALLLASMISFSLVGVWEVYEYWSDRYLGTKMVHGIDDTMIDISLGFLSILICWLILDVKLKGKRNIKLNK